VAGQSRSSGGPQRIPAFGSARTAGVSGFGACRGLRKEETCRGRSGRGCSGPSSSRRKVSILALTSAGWLMLEACVQPSMTASRAGPASPSRSSCALASEMAVSALPCTIHQAAERGGDLLDVGRGPFGVPVVPLPRAQDVDQTTSWTGPGPCSRNPNRAAPQLMSNSRPVGSMRGSFRLRSASKSIVLPAGAGAPWLAVLGGMCGLAGK
jgi:hypothetical protein